jgi:hypothetical protein
VYVFDGLYQQHGTFGTVNLDFQHADTAKIKDRECIGAADKSSYELCMNDINHVLTSSKYVRNKLMVARGGFEQRTLSSYEIN